MISPQQAPVYTMVAAAEADREIADAEIGGDRRPYLPIFKGVDRAAMNEMATRCWRRRAGPSGSST